MLKEKNKINSICHCERSEAISQKIAMSCGLAMTESGRSMVEMLGVLAVIGVLSVAGIAGYSNAMKKHRANEILNEASKRAVLVAAQAMTGKTGSISLGEFTQNTFSGVTFANTATVADNKITLILSGSGLPDICDQLKNATGDNTVMKITQDDCSVLTFNNDMSTGTSGGATSECDPACESGQECVGGACVTVTPDSSNGCSKNSDCEAGCASGKTCYCAISSSPNYDDDNCYLDFTGTCAEVETKSGISGGYVASNEGMTWWSAVNFCKAAKTGGKLVSLSDLGITGGYEDEAYCDASSCTGANWSDLRSKLGSNYYWVTDAVSCTDPENWEGCTSGSNNNSCIAFRVSTDDSSVFNDCRYSIDFGSALCK